MNNAHIPDIFVSFATDHEADASNHSDQSTAEKQLEHDTVASSLLSPVSSPPQHKRRQKVHEMLVELFDLKQNGVNQGLEWRETARWMKYEEDVGVDNHWGLPHVACMPFHDLLQLRKCLQEGVVLLDVKATNFGQVGQQIAAELSKPVKGHGGGTTHAQPDESVPTIQSAIINMLNLVSIRHVSDTPTRKKTIALDSTDRKQSYFVRKFSQFRKPSQVPPAVQNLRSENAAHGLVDAQPPGRREGGGGKRKQTSAFLRKMSTPFRSYSTAVKQHHHDRRRKLTAAATSFNEADEDAALSRSPSIHSVVSSITDALERGGVPGGCLAEDTELVQVFSGVVADMPAPRLAMVRLAAALYRGDDAFDTVPYAPTGGVLPVRFLFVVLGPALDDMNYQEVGRAIATLMSDKAFHTVAYRATEKTTLLAAMDTFLDMSVVVPPGDIDSRRLVNVDDIGRLLRHRKTLHAKADATLVDGADGDSEEDGSVASLTVDGEDHTAENPLERKRRPFHGLRKDIAARLPFYWSDLRDAANFRCLTAVIFMFFASFAPAITFGGLMGTYTQDAMGTTETLMAQCVCGLVWGLFAAQPLLIMSATGPVLIFEASLFAFCQHLDVDFLTVRVWAGGWLLVLAIVTVAFEGVVLVRHVTRFTEDIFAALISVIFIAEAASFVAKTFARNPLGSLDNYVARRDECLLQFNNGTSSNTSNELAQNTCLLTQNHPDTGLLTAILVVSTFALAFAFRKIRTSVYLGRERCAGDWNCFRDIHAAVQIFLLTACEYVWCIFHVLDMPPTFDFTSPAKRKHRILIDPLLPADKWWGYLFALLPAFLVFILLFVETEITELLLSKKEKGLRKGRGGFHWDLLLVGFLAFLCGLLGLPWMCAAAVQSLAHVGALTVYQRHAPGERAKVDYVVEQRVTTLGVSALVGACAFGGVYLRVLPLAVLFGVFLYLGVMNLAGVQLVRRMVLFFIPRKHFPDHAYCQQVSTWRMHAYTALQLTCLGVVYLVKHFKTTALAFPFVLSLIALLRRVVVPRLFTEHELHALDGHEDTDGDDRHDSLDLFGRINVY